MDFYIRDIPRASANGGECRSAYAGALNKGVAASKRYHSDALALSQKIETLSKQAEATLNSKMNLEMVAAASR